MACLKPAWRRRQARLGANVKLVIAIVQDEDMDGLTEALIAAGDLDGTGCGAIGGICRRTSIEGCF